MALADRPRVPGLKGHPKRPEAEFHTRVHGRLTQPVLGWLRATNVFNKRQAVFFFTQTWDDEDVFQMHLLDTLYAIMPSDFEAFHTPNGGLRNKVVAAALKRIGARAGVYDLFCGWNGGHGWLECKAHGGKRSTAQKQFGEWVNKTGGHHETVRTISLSIRALIGMKAPVPVEYQALAYLAPT